MIKSSDFPLKVKSGVFRMAKASKSTAKSTAKKPAKKLAKKPVKAAAPKPSAKKAPEKEAAAKPKKVQAAHPIAPVKTPAGKGEPSLKAELAKKTAKLTAVASTPKAKPEAKADVKPEIKAESKLEKRQPWKDKNLSPEEAEEVQKLHRQWRQMHEQLKDVKPVPYILSGSYEAKTPIQHKIMGWGYVLKNRGTRIEVLFEDGIRTLVSNYNPV
jgi:hypothetical protein